MIVLRNFILLLCLVGVEVQLSMYCIFFRQSTYKPSSTRQRYQPYSKPQSRTR